MKVFKDLELVEEFGTGIKRILKSYDKSCFEFSRNFITVTFPFNKNDLWDDKKEEDNKPNIDKVDIPELSETQKAIIELMLKDSRITQTIISKKLNINIRTVQRNIKKLMNFNILNRVGATKGGEWIVNNYERK